jgi:hypothetical protein
MLGPLLRQVGVVELQQQVFFRPKVLTRVLGKLVQSFLEVTPSWDAF